MINNSSDLASLHRNYNEYVFFKKILISYDWNKALNFAISLSEAGCQISETVCSDGLAEEKDRDNGQRGKDRQRRKMEGREERLENVIRRQNWTKCKERDEGWSQNANIHLLNSLACVNGNP
jgi:hypothetical protein